MPKLSDIFEPKKPSTKLSTFFENATMNSALTQPLKAESILNNATDFNNAKKGLIGTTIGNLTPQQKENSIEIKPVNWEQHDNLKNQLAAAKVEYGADSRKAKELELQLNSVFVPKDQQFDAKKDVINPFIKGIGSGLTLGLADEAINSNLDMQSSNTALATGANIVGNVAASFLPIGVVNKAAEGILEVPRVAKLFNGIANPLVKKAVVDGTANFLVNSVTSTPRIIDSGMKQGKDFNTIMGEVLADEAINTVLGVALGQLGKSPELKQAYAEYKAGKIAEKELNKIINDTTISELDKAKAKFILTEQGLSDILQESLGAPAWHSGLFSLTAMPGNDITELASYWGVEGTNIPFRWVSDGRNGTLLLGLYKRTNQSNYLFMCAESGPSVGYRPVSVNIFDARNQLAGTMIFSSYACHTINVSRFQPPFSLKHNEDGVIASYIDQRKLIYRVMHIGFSPTAEVDQSYLTLNNGKDIVDSRYTATNAKPKIMLGAGWYSYETYQNESFRWANNNPEIIVSNSSVPGWLAINVAPGPSAGKDILNLELLDSKNKNVGSCIVNSRKICTFPISHMESGKSKYRLHSDATGVPIPTDPRKLNFRVFGIEWQ